MLHHRNTTLKAGRSNVLTVRHSKFGPIPSKVGCSHIVYCYFLSSSESQDNISPSHNISTPSLTTTTSTPDNSTPSQHSAEGRPFKCPDCPKTFKVRRHLQVHYRIHSGVRPYECKECGLTFNQQGPLQVLSEGATLLSLEVRTSVFAVSDQVRHKLGCTAAEYC